jgi:hypothetical protein
MLLFVHASNYFAKVHMLFSKKYNQCFPYLSYMLPFFLIHAANDYLC